MVVGFITDVIATMDEESIGLVSHNNKLWYNRTIHIPGNTPAR